MRGSDGRNGVAEMPARIPKIAGRGPGRGQVLAISSTGFEEGVRVLIYSHDTFGLGHLRRSRAIANAIVAEWPEASVVIISGSPVIGNFEFAHGVDYIRIPGVTKLPDGDYRSLNLNLP